MIQFSAVRVLAPLVGVVLGTSLLAGAAMAQTVSVRYSVSLIGLPLGTAGLQAHLEDSHYSVTVDAKLTGLAALISRSKGAAKATGGLVDGHLAPATYATTSANDRETRTVRMAMNAGTVRAVQIVPPFEPPPDRVPVTEADKRNIVDPVSALVMPVPAGEPLVGASACNRTIPVFDGYTRFNIRLTYVGIRKVHSRGYAGPVSVCAARYIPVAGHRPGKAVTKFMTENKDMEAWLLPVESAHLEMPFRISVRTLLGTTVIQAQELSIDHSRRASE